MQAAEQLPQSEGRVERPPRENREAQQARIQAIRTETDRVRSEDIHDRTATLSQIYMRLNSTRTVDEAMTMARRDIMGEEALLKSRQVVAIPEEELQQVQSDIRVTESMQKGTLGSGEASTASAEWTGQAIGSTETAQTTFQNVDASGGESRAEPMSFGMKAPLPELKLEPLAPETAVSPEKTTRDRRRDALARLQKLSEEAKSAVASAEASAKQELASTTDEDIDSALDRLTPTDTPPPSTANTLH